MWSHAGQMSSICLTPLPSSRRHPWEGEDTRTQRVIKARQGPAGDAPRRHRVCWAKGPSGPHIQPGGQQGPGRACPLLRELPERHGDDPRGGRRDDDDDDDPGGSPLARHHPGAAQDRLQQVGVLPRCYRNAPHQEDPGAPSVTPNDRVLAGIGLLGYPQVGPGGNS